MVINDLDSKRAGVLKKEIIIHVGLFKTASTYFQNNFFTFLKDVYCPFYKERIDSRKGIASSNPHNHLYGFMRKVWHVLPIDLKEEKEKIYGYLEKIPESKILLTFEGFSKPGFYEDYTKILKGIFPEAKIFLVVREQVGWLESLYRETIKGGNKTPGIDNFLALNAHNCNWMEIYSHYKENFGEKNVLVLPFEMFTKDRQKFYDNFFEFTGIKPFYPEAKSENSSLSALSICIISFLNVFSRVSHFNNLKVRGLIEFLDKIVKINFKLISKKQKNFIRSFYEKSNKTLAQKTGLHLEKYGYFSKKPKEITLSKGIDFQKNIDRLAEKHKNKKILIYGIGKDFFEKIAKNYDLSALNIIGVSDKDFYHSEEQTYLEYKVIDPENINNHDFDVVVLGITNIARSVNTVKQFLKYRLTNKNLEIDILHNYSFIDKIKMLFLP